MHPWALAGSPVVGSVNQAYFFLAGEVSRFPNLHILWVVHKITSEKKSNKGNKQAGETAARLGVQRRVIGQWGRAWDNGLK